MTITLTNWNVLFDSGTMGAELPFDAFLSAYNGVLYKLG
jgi:hypothetical protein